MYHVMQPMFRPLTRWAEESQRRSRRNAMVASTVLTAVRHERDEVQEFIVAALARRTPAPVPQLPTSQRPGSAETAPATVAR
jgi:hypothetical protein